jgi:zinc protease
MVMAVVGAVSVEEVLDTAAQHFVAKRKRGALNHPRSWNPPKGPVQVSRSMDKEQSHVVLGFPGGMLNGVDRYSIDVLVEILGGHGGRLFERIRERQSLAYDVAGISFDGLEPGFVAFYAGTSPGNEKRVVDTILEEIESARRDGPRKDELERVIRYLVGSREIAGQRFAARAADMSLGYLYGLGHDASARYVEEISKVTVNKVMDVARRYLNSDHLVISCAGPDAKSIRFF